MPREPKKINSYVLVDFETGGLFVDKNPIMSMALVAIDGTTLEEIVKYDNLVKPYDDKLVYEPAAMNINGLSKMKCMKEGVSLKELVDDACTVFKEANIYNTKTAKPKLIAHHWPFDRKFLQDIFRRCGIDLGIYVAGDKDAFGNFIPDGLDTIDWAKALHAPLTENTTSFKLGSCLQRSGIDFSGDAHTALGDTLSLTDMWRFFVTRLRSGSSEVTVSEGRAVINHRNNFEW